MDITKQMSHCIVKLKNDVRIKEKSFVSVNSLFNVQAGVSPVWLN